MKLAEFESHGKPVFIHPSNVLTIEISQEDKAASIITMVGDITVYIVEPAEEVARVINEAMETPAPVA